MAHMGHQKKENEKALLRCFTIVPVTVTANERTVVTSLEQLSADGNAKASGYLLSVLQFDFIVTLIAIEHVLASLVPLSKLLQGKSCDLIRAATERRVVKALIQEISNNECADDNVWDALYQKAVDLASVVDVVPSIPRNVGRQRKIM